jgi:hypothetical protein
LSHNLVRRGGRLQATQVEGARKPSVLNAIVGADGAVVCYSRTFAEPVDRPGHSLTEAARWAAGRVTSASIKQSGWDFWQYVDEAGRQTPMAVLRERLLAKLGDARVTRAPSPPRSGRPVVAPPETARLERSLPRLPDDQPLVTAELPARGPTYRNDRSHVSLRDLLDAGLLRPRTKLYPPGGGHEVTAVVDDQAMVLLRDKTYEAVSPAAAHAAELLRLARWSYDGWTFWCFQDTDGRLQPLDELRRRYQQRRTVGRNSRGGISPSPNQRQR